MKRWLVTLIYHGMPSYENTEVGMTKPAAIVAAERYAHVCGWPARSDKANAVELKAQEVQPCLA